MFMTHNQVVAGSSRGGERGSRTFVRIALKINN